MLVALADDVQEHGDVFKVVRNGKTLALHRPTRKGMEDIQELMKIRHFLEQSGKVAEQPASDGVEMLVVIDHRQASVYRTELHGAVPHRITPLDTSASARHLHYVQDDSNGQRKPEQKNFYEAIAASLAGAKKILLFGSGTGASSAMGHLLEELKKHHADIFKRVVGSVPVNEQHLTENQLLAKAREFYATLAV